MLREKETYSEARRTVRRKQGKGHRKKDSHYLGNSTREVKSGTGLAKNRWSTFSICLRLWQEAPLNVFHEKFTWIRIGIRMGNEGRGLG